MKVLSLFVSLLLMFALATGCSDDPTDPGPENGTISGTVNFVGNWPANTNYDVQVSLWSELGQGFIPTGAPAGSSEPIAFNSTSFNFSFEGVEKAEYKAIYVGFRDPANPAGAGFVGMYWTLGDSVGIAYDSTFMTGLPIAPPTAITIDDNTLSATGIQIKANLNLIP